jgi:hypothetical protein
MMDLELVQGIGFKEFLFIKKMRKSFASYELKVLHYGLLNVETTHHISKSP